MDWVNFASNLMNWRTQPDLIKTRVVLSHAPHRTSAHRASPLIPRALVGAVGAPSTCQRGAM